MFSLITLLFVILPIGEELHYTVRFGPFSVGTLSLTIDSIVRLEQESCYHFTTRLKSNPNYRFLFRIDYQLESYARITDFATLKSVKRISESNYRNETEANFDYKSRKIYYSDSSVFDLASETKDLLSTWYYFRTLNLKPQDTFQISIHIDKKSYPIKIEVFGPKLVQTGVGKFECLIIVPQTRVKQDVGIIYLSNDEHRIPAMIKKRFSFGSIVAVLTKIGG